MAKRPPSSPKSEEDMIGASEVVGVGAADAEQVGPVAMEEPSQEEPQHVDQELAAPETADQWVDKERGDDVAADAGGVTTEPVDAVPEAPQLGPTPPQQHAERSRGGFIGTALGGVVAAAAGYALATFVPFSGIGMSDAPATATQAEVQALSARIATLETAPSQDADLSDRIAALEARPDAVEPDLAPLADSLATLEGRVAALENRAPAQPGEAPAAELSALVESLRAEVAEMQAAGADANAGIEALAVQTEARLAEAEAQATALRAEAEQTARRAVTAAALGRIQAALETGVPFAGALADIPDVEMPAPLSRFAENGVPTRAALQDAFPPVARAALEASLRANMGEGWSDRVASFLQATTGARSLVPREGSDPDAVLSRAEAAVRSGDLAQALKELESLPPEGQAEMADWTEMARQRLDAITAASTLSAAVEG